MKFVLEASKKGKKASVVIESDTSYDAMMEGVACVLERSSSSALWAEGRITLTNEDGVVVHEMSEVSL